MTIMENKYIQIFCYVYSRKTTTCFIYYRKSILQITQPIQYRCTQLQYRHPVRSQMSVYCILTVRPQVSKKKHWGGLPSRLG